MGHAELGDQVVDLFFGSVCQVYGASPRVLRVRIMRPAEGGMALPSGRPGPDDSISSDQTATAAKMSVLVARDVSSPPRRDSRVFFD